MFCKTIILSNTQNLNTNAPKGILTLSDENQIIKGKIRLYNITKLPLNTKIGLYIDEKVHISTITKKPNHYEFKLDEKVDITKNIYCAIIDNTNNAKNVLLEGGTNSFCFTDSPFDAVLEAKDDELDQTIDNALSDIDACEQCNCCNCAYKNYFYEHYSNPIEDQAMYSYNPNTNTPQISKNENMQDTTNLENINKPNNLDTSLKSITNPIDKFQEQVIENLEQEIIDDLTTLTFNNNTNFDDISQDINNQQTLVNAFEQIVENKVADEKSDNAKDNSTSEPQQTEQTEFLNDVIYQLDEMFNTYPEDEMLNSIIPNSRFIKVNCERAYVLGVIYEDKQLKYIAYGVPAQYNSIPPTDFGKHYQWLPLNPRDIMSDGYFMIYQDALSGTIVEINFED